MGKNKRGESNTGKFQLRPLSAEERRKLGIDECYRPHEVPCGKAKKPAYSFLKRIIDIIASAIILVCISPFLLVLMLLIYIEDPHASPIFKQERIGIGGKPFKLYKLRSMYSDAEKKLGELKKQNEVNGKVFKMKDDPRVTRIGAFIRSRAIDETLQFANVLKGDMSIVGPRPALPSEVGEYDAYERQRLLIKPGLTCLWQVYPARHEVSFDDWIAMDLKYIESRTLALDAKLILKTAASVLKGDAD